MKHSLMDADAQFQAAIYEEIQEFFDATDKPDPTDALRILQTYLESTFWMIWTEEKRTRDLESEQWSCGLCDQPTPKGQNVCARCARIPF